jgi:hypothetical protein
MLKIFITIAIILVTNLTSFNSAIAKKIEVGEKIAKDLEQYHWYDNVRKYIKREQTYYIDYNIRRLVVQYLEMKGVEKYQAEDTYLCIDEDRYEYSKDFNTCYHGTAKQNFALLKALQSKKIKDHLLKTSAYLIINGKNDNFWDPEEKDFIAQCPEYIGEIKTKTLRDLEMNDENYIFCTSKKNDIQARNNLPR